MPFAEGRGAFARKRPERPATFLTPLDSALDAASSDGPSPVLASASFLLEGDEDFIIIIYNIV